MTACAACPAEACTSCWLTSLARGKARRCITCACNVAHSDSQQNAGSEVPEGALAPHRRRLVPAAGVAPAGHSQEVGDKLTVLVVTPAGLAGRCREHGSCCKLCSWWVNDRNILTASTIGSGRPAQAGQGSHCAGLTTFETQTSPVGAISGA